MADQLSFEATLTDKYQNTVPSAVRTALGLGKRDKVRYIIRGDEIVLQKAEASEQAEDPVVLSFLDFLQRDMIDNPGHLSPLSAVLIDEARALTKGVEFDLDAPLEDD